MFIEDPVILWYIIFALIIIIVCLVASTIVFFLKYKRMLPTFQPAVGLEKKVVPLTARIAGRCNICIKRIEEGDLMVVCPSCRKTYHLSCAAHIGICPTCGKSIQPEVEQKPAPEKAPQAPPQIDQKEILMPTKAPSTNRCSACARVIEIDELMIMCVCGRVYHPGCAKQFGRCKNCNKEIYHTGI